jgi:hypothetical protein
MRPTEQQRCIIALARSFPSLAHRFHNPAYGLDPWDPDQLVICAVTWPPAEQQVVAFLLSVWKPGHGYGKTFNLVEAVAHWSEGDRKALIGWALNPVSF